MRFTILKENKDYAVTKTGRIYSHKSGKWTELKPQTDTDGYQQVRLFNNGSGRLTFVHRIVAETFLNKSTFCNEVNHKDGDKKNNNVKNLEWCTRQHNILHAHDSGLVGSRTPISITNISTGETMFFKGQHDAARKLHINQGNINHALKRNNGTCYGYRVEYASKEDV